MPAARLPAFYVWRLLSLITASKPKAVVCRRMTADPCLSSQQVASCATLQWIFSCCVSGDKLGGNDPQLSCTAWSIYAGLTSHLEYKRDGKRACTVRLRAKMAPEGCKRLSLSLQHQYSYNIFVRLAILSFLNPNHVTPNPACISGLHQQCLPWLPQVVCISTLLPASPKLASSRLPKMQKCRGSSLQTLKGYSGPVNAIAFSPDGKLTASASRDKTVKLWDTAAWAPRATLEGHLYPVRAVAFSPELASASSDTVRLWDVVTRALRTKFKGHADPITPSHSRRMGS
jgi:hypothetical protein